MTLHSDRTVHGITQAGAQIVRYDRAGKWYIEPTNQAIRRKCVTVVFAAEQAAKGKHFARLSGGQAFDRHVCKFKETPDA